MVWECRTEDEIDCVGLDVVVGRITGVGRVVDTHALRSE